MKGNVTEIKRLNKHACSVSHSDGIFNVYQLSNSEIDKLLYEVKSNGLLFRITDGVLKPNHWCHFIRSHNGVDGSSFATGAIFHTA